MNDDYDFSIDPEPLLATLTSLFAAERATREVAILAAAKQVAIRQEQCDENYIDDVRCYSLYLLLPVKLYTQISNERAQHEKAIQHKLSEIMRASRYDEIQRVYISPMIEEDRDWRDKAFAWLAGDGVSNQGRVHSDNLPTCLCDGLLFRSLQEINLYKALKALGVSFAPLPVFIRGGEEYRRIETDFVIVKDGIVLLVEVDGDTTHTETPVEAHLRTTMLIREGVKLERVKAKDCATQELANKYAKTLLQIIDKLKASR